MANTEKNWLAHRILANHYLAAEDYERCIRYCEQTLKWGRENPEIYSTYGRALYAQGSKETGLELLKQATVSFPEVALFRANLGWVYLDMQRYEEAIDIPLQQYERARQRLLRGFETSGGDVAAFELLASTYAAESNWKEAAAVYQSLIQQIPHHYDARLNLSDMLINMQQLEPARQQLQSLINELR